MSGTMSLIVSSPSSDPLFFSNIRRHTRYWRDWSSDVCSSDLVKTRQPVHKPFRIAGREQVPVRAILDDLGGTSDIGHDHRHTGRELFEGRHRERLDRRAARSEERRVGKGVDLGGRRIIKKKTD